MFLYTPKYRPPAFAGLPRGFELIETPQDRTGYNRPDLPTSQHRFGVIGWSERLSTEDVEKFQLTYLGEGS